MRLVYIWPALLMLFASSCAPSERAAMYEPFGLPFGQSATLRSDSLTLTFNAVLRDERCPTGSLCSEQGSVLIRVAVQQEDQEPAVYEMSPDPGVVHLGWGPDRVNYLDYEIWLVDVEPQPEQDEDLIRLSDYEATFIVTH